MTLPTYISCLIVKSIWCSL